jgi:hypothetical protein
MATTSTFTEKELEGIFPPEGADYDEWLDAKTQRAIDSPGPYYTHEEVQEIMRPVREAAMAKIAEQEAAGKLR